MCEKLAIAEDLRERLTDNAKALAETIKITIMKAEKLQKEVINTDRVSETNINHYI